MTVLPQSELRQKVEQLVADDQLRLALDVLHEYYQQNKKLRQQIILLTARLKEIDVQYRSGNITYQQYRTARSSIRTAILGIPDDEPLPPPDYRRHVVFTVVLQTLQPQPQGITINDLLHLAQFNESENKRLFRRLVADVLKELQTNGLINKSRNMRVPKEERRTLYRLTDQGLQLLRAFEHTILFRKKEG